MANKDVSSIEKGAGYFLGFITTLMNVARQKEVPFEAIYRLGTEGGYATVVKIVDVAYTDWFAEQPKPVEQPQGGPTNGNSPFLASVVYIQPEFEELKRRFPAFVSPDYKDSRFDPIERCKSVSKENREIAFEYVHMNRSASTGEVLAEMDRRGLRPALYEELLGFAEKYRDEYWKHPIVALGSVRGDRRVAYLWDVFFRRALGLYCIDSGWEGICRFLAVRK